MTRFASLAICLPGSIQAHILLVYHPIQGEPLFVAKYHLPSQSLGHCNDCICHGHSPAIITWPLGNTMIRNIGVKLQLIFGYAAESALGHAEVVPAGCLPCGISKFQLFITL